jgi:hypothetical protein
LRSPTSPNQFYLSRLMQEKNIHLVTKICDVSDKKQLFSNVEKWKNNNNWSIYFKDHNKISEGQILPSTAYINGVFYAPTFSGVEFYGWKDSKPNSISINNSEDQKFESILSAIKGEKIEVENSIVKYKTSTGYSVWIDKKTNLPIKYERQIPNSAGNSDYRVETTISYNEIPPPFVFTVSKEMKESPDLQQIRLLWSDALKNPKKIKRLKSSELRILSADRNKYGDVFVVYALPKNVKINSASQRCNIESDQRDRFNMYDSINPFDSLLEIDDWRICSAFAINTENKFSSGSIYLTIDKTAISVPTPLISRMPLIGKIREISEMPQDDVVIQFSFDKPTCDIMPDKIRQSSFGQDPVRDLSILRDRQHIDALYMDRTVTWVYLEAELRQYIQKWSSQNVEYILRWALALTALGSDEEARMAIRKAESIWGQSRAKGSSELGRQMSGSPLGWITLTNTPHPQRKGDNNAYNPLTIQGGNSYLRQIVQKETQKRKSKGAPLD